MLSRSTSPLLPVLALAALAFHCGGTRADGGGEPLPTEDAPPRSSSGTAPTEPADPLDPGGSDGGPVGDGGASELIPASAFSLGIVASTPSKTKLLPLPGGGEGEPVLTSNNPEAFTGAGTLYTNARAMPGRGGQPTRLPRIDGGSFGVYLHHLNASSATRFVGLLVTNPNGAPVTASLEGAGYTQADTGGVALGASPDYRVSRDVVTGTKSTVAQVTVDPLKGALLWTRPVAAGHEVDARFTVTASAAVNVYVVATDEGTVTSALAVTQPIREAPGDYRVSGAPAPPFGRAAGVYARDTWRARFDAELPDGEKNVALMVNTATGGDVSPSQAFPAIVRLDQSAAEAVGMYGNMYDLDIGLRNGGVRPRRVRIAFHSLGGGSPSRLWDGAARVDDRLVEVRHTPSARTTTLFDEVVHPGTRRVHFRAMVPGLASIPQALTIETRD